MIITFLNRVSNNIIGRLKLLLDNKNDRSYIIGMTIETKKQIKRKKMLDQGVIMLMTRGYHNTGVQEILDASQIPKGSFYSYFGSKEAFCAEAIDHYIEPLIIQLQNYLNDEEFSGMDILKNHLNELIRSVEKNKFETGCLLGNLMGEIGNTSKVCRVALQTAVNRYRNLIKEAILKAQKSGQIRIDISAEILADLLVNNWQGALLRMKIEKSVIPLQSCRDSMLDGYFKS